jgi:hypothetical protein
MTNARGRRRTFAHLVTWALASCAVAQEPSAAPSRTFQDPLLDSLAGKWNVAREIRGKVEKNTLDAEWVLLHQFLQLHMKDLATPPKYEAIVLIGYDPDAQRYVIHWCDAWGGKYSLTGHGKRAGDSIEFVFEDPESPFYNTFSRDSDGRWTFRMENGGKDGTRKFFAKDTLTRR